MVELERLPFRQSLPIRGGGRIGRMPGGNPAAPAKSLWPPPHAHDGAKKDSARPGARSAHPAQRLLKRSSQRVEGGKHSKTASCQAIGLNSSNHEIPQSPTHSMSQMWRTGQSVSVGAFRSRIFAFPADSNRSRPTKMGALKCTARAIESEERLSNTFSVSFTATVSAP